MKRLSDDSVLLMARAIDDGIFDPIAPVIPALWEEDALTKCLMGQLVNTVISPWLGHERSWQLPQTKRFQASRKPAVGPILHPTTTAPYPPWLVELARYTVAPGSIGIIKSFEQFLAGKDEQETIIYTCMCAQGNPYPDGLTDYGSWHFRLSNISQTRRPWVNLASPLIGLESIPGTPYTDLPQEDEIWWPAHSASSQNIHLPIPGGYLLRVFFFTPAQATVRLSAACKLKGTNQVEYGNEAQLSARALW